MSKKQRQISDVADQALRDQINAFEQKLDAQEAEQASQLARIRLEKEAQELSEYAARRINAAILTGEVSSSLRPLLAAGKYSSYEAISRAIAAAKAATAELTTSATVPDTALSAPSQPRDETTGQFIPAQESQQEQPQEIDLARLTLAEYAEQVRGRLNMDGRGIENVGRAPGHERQSFMGHTLDEGSGFPDWRDSSANERVFESQIDRQPRRRG